MTETSKENSAAEGGLDIRAADVAAALLRRNPDASDDLVASTARLMAMVGETVQTPERYLPSEQLIPAPRSDTVRLLLFELKAALAEFSDQLERPYDRERNAGPQRLILAPRGAVESLQGTGFGARMTLAKARETLFVEAEPLALEEWAGPLAGPTELTRRLNIPRSTLQDWRRDGTVIGLLRGRRKHVFPLAQFVDGRPLKGLAEVLSIIEDPRAAWLWLVEPGRAGGSHLGDLKRGRIAAVLDAAREDFA